MTLKQVYTAKYKSILHLGHLSYNSRHFLEKLTEFITALSYDNTLVTPILVISGGCKSLVFKDLILIPSYCHDLLRNICF